MSKRKRSPNGFRKIFCCGCQRHVTARLTRGSEIYPHLPKLSHLPFWRCDSCKNYVGCHHKTKTPTQPLGVIPTAELRGARQGIHTTMDQLMKAGYQRTDLYRRISKHIGRDYHTADLRSLEDADKVQQFLDGMLSQIVAMHVIQTVEGDRRRLESYAQFQNALVEANRNVKMESAGDPGGLGAHDGGSGGSGDPGGG